MDRFWQVNGPISWAFGGSEEDPANNSARSGRYGGWRGVRANLGGMDAFQVEFGGEFSKSGWYGLIL